MIYIKHPHNYLKTTAVESRKITVEQSGTHRSV
jgi:hypothetical protein